MVLESGRVLLKYGSNDTILDLKRQLEASHRYPVDSQQFTFSGGTPNDPSEHVGDTRRVQEFAARSGVLRDRVVEAAQPNQVRYIHRDRPCLTESLRNLGLSSQQHDRQCGSAGKLDYSCWR